MAADDPSACSGRLPVAVASTGRSDVLARALAVVLSCSVGFMLAPQVTAATGSSETAASVGFGEAVPNERFVHEFQRQVMLQLQSTLNQATREQDDRLKRFEERQNQRLKEQSEILKHTLGDLREHLFDGSSAERDAAPHVNIRHAPEQAGPAPGHAEPDNRLPEAFSVLQPGSAGTPPSAQANLSPHGFAQGRLLNGVVAVLGGSDRESVVALTGPYRAANGFLTDLDGCFALVQGRPDLAAGRIDFKVSRLTCNFPDGASKTWDVSGWLVDIDGIRGLRAQIVQNVGRKAAVAAVGGALSGFGKRLSQQQYQITASPLGSSSAFVGNATHDAIGGSADGAANALEQSIADYYNLYAPSLQVGGGTPTSLVIANELKFPRSGRSLTQTHSVAP
jgi:hypothetical protein